MPPHVEYQLTESGEKLMEIIHLIAGWGMDYIQEHCPQEEKKAN